MKLLEKIMRRRNRTRNSVLVLIDWENLFNSLTATAFEQFAASISIHKALNETIERIARQIGAICGVYVFTPPHLASLHGEDLFRKQYYIVYCPKVEEKGGKQRIDTVDKTLIRFGLSQLQTNLSLTHLVLGSGDQDYVPFLIEAKRSGLEIVIIAGSVNSLSKELIPLAEASEGSKTRQIFLLSDISNI